MGGNDAPLGWIEDQGFRERVGSRRVREQKTLSEKEPKRVWMGKCDNKG